MTRFHHIWTVMLVSLLSIAESGLAQTTCAGDCDGDSSVSINELINGININLGRVAVATCPAMDVDDSGTVTVGELVAAIDHSLRGCNTIGKATFEQVQSIFNSRCTFSRCHGNGFSSEGLDLEEGESFDLLVGVAPENRSAREAGMLRVDPGNAANSFLVVKVSGIPPEGFGRRMPIGGGPLNDLEVQAIRDWINRGALP